MSNSADFLIEDKTLTRYVGKSDAPRVPHGVRVIADGAFEKCDGLVSVRLPASLRRVGHGAFRNCASLRSVVLPRGVREIGEGAFEGCTALTEIVLPPRLRRLPDDALRRCESLVSLTLPVCLTHLGCNALSGCTALREIRIPKGIQKLHIGVLSHCAALERVVLPKGLRVIGEDAFMGCASLVRLEIPKRVFSLSSAFEQCASLRQICFEGENKIELGVGAFSGLSCDASITYGGESTVFEEMVAPCFGPLYHITMGDFARGYRYPMFHRELGSEFSCKVFCKKDKKELCIKGVPYQEMEQAPYYGR